MTINDLLAPPTQPMERVVATVRQAQRQPHLLAVAVAVVTKGTEVLVVCRRSTAESGITWQFPAGMVKPGVRPQDVAMRETLRETGVHCAVTRELGRRLHPITNVICDYWFCEYVAGDATNIDTDENISVTWIERDKLTRIIPVDQIFPPVLDALKAC
jgi:8-oxo-dGTP diphosphatase